VFITVLETSAGDALFEIYEGNSANYETFNALVGLRKVMTERCDELGSQSPMT
jgi:hypothetical protein